MTCPVCHRTYRIRDDIAILLPEYDDEERRRYLESYQKIATDDLLEPLEARRDTRHHELLAFIGDVRGKRVLDIGSGNAAYLQKMDAALKVAVDIAMPYLDAIPTGAGVMKVCADAEMLPVASGFFDVIILDSVLEHVLDPEKVVAKVHQACRPDTRVIVVVPWEEDLEPYRSLPWEFTHLRSFNSSSFSALWHQFSIKRRKPIWPRLADPFLFRVDEWLPTPVFDFLRYGYFHRGGAARDAERRARWSAELPRREQRLLRYYRPTFYQFELQTYARSWVPRWHDKLARWRRT